MISNVEYLVKPYIDSKDLPIDGCAKMEISSRVHNPFIEVLREISRKNISPDEYLNKMLLLWKDRVDYVASDSNSLFVMIDIFRDDSYRPIQLIQLRDYATAKLHNRFVSLYSGYDTAKYLANQEVLDKVLNIHAYGEISDRCASGETNELVRELKQLDSSVNICVNFDKNLCPDTIDGKFD